MKENIENRSLGRRLFPRISEEENVKIFSKQRAKRGAKIGGVIGAGSVVGTTAVALVTGIIEPAAILQTPLPNAEITALYAIYWAGVGSAVDGFKLPSRAIGLQNTLEKNISKK